MANLEVKYMNLALKNPLVVAASSLTSTPEGVAKAVEAGAGAVVLKSLFEEQIMAEINSDFAGIDLDAYPEADAFITRTGWEEGAGNYLRLVEGASKAAGDVPVFASINCVGAGNWADFAKNIASAGAAGIELNIAYLPYETGLTAQDIESRVLSTVREVRKVTKLPLAVKLGASYSSVPNMARELSKAGANSLVLFNRFYRFDFDVEAMKLKAAQALSSADDYHESLRWISLLYRRAGIELAATTGVHNAETVVKMIMAGADVVQICSILYRNGWKALSDMLTGLHEWLDARGQSSIETMQGKLSAYASKKPEEFMRLQYIKALTGIH